MVFGDYEYLCWSCWMCTVCLLLIGSDKLQSLFKSPPLLEMHVNIFCLTVKLQIPTQKYVTYSCLHISY